jgi:hypothetical protein
VFVSEALRRRAIAEYGADERTTLTSPNGTEPCFLYDERLDDTEGLPDRLARCRRPIVGVLGGLSTRLDLDLLHAVADLDEVGTLALIGPLGEGLPESALALCRHGKAVVTGAVPCAQMHRYAHAFDAALIPYAVQSINYFCSPVRLYDHLATGVPVFSTKACDQINAYGAPVVIDEPGALPARIAAALRAGARARRPDAQEARKLLWSSRAEHLVQVLDAL